MMVAKLAHDALDASSGEHARASALNCRPEALDDSTFLSAYPLNQ